MDAPGMGILASTLVTVNWIVSFKSSHSMNAARFTVKCCEFYRCALTVICVAVLSQGSDVVIQSARHATCNDILLRSAARTTATHVYVISNVLEAIPSLQGGTFYECSPIRKVAKFTTISAPQIIPCLTLRRLVCSCQSLHSMHVL